MNVCLLQWEGVRDIVFDKMEIEIKCLLCLYFV